MKFQIIKDLDSTKTEILYFLWSLKDDGKLGNCITCSSELDKLEAKLDKEIKRQIMLKDFKPEIIKEIEI